MAITHPCNASTHIIIIIIIIIIITHRKKGKASTHLLRVVSPGNNLRRLKWPPLAPRAGSVPVSVLSLQFQSRSWFLRQFQLVDR
jgi:hypothetical protein